MDNSSTAGFGMSLPYHSAIPIIEVAEISKLRINAERIENAGKNFKMGVSLPSNGQEYPEKLQKPENSISNSTWYDMEIKRQNNHSLTQ